MSNPYGESFGWTYLDNGWLWQQQSGSAATAIYTYNALGQVTELAYRKSSNNALLADFANLSHDAVGNRLSLSASLPLSPTSYSGSTSYSYDNKEQLTQESSTRAGGYSNGYGYDLVGNPTTFKGVTQTFNSANQNTQGGTIAFDSNGNPQTWNGAALTYNANDKLVSIGTVLSAGYGSDGLRAWKQSSAGRTYFLYDGLVPVCEVDGSGNVTAVNTVGANGLVARHMNGTGGGSVFYAFDPQGSVSVRLDTSGNVLSSHVNEAWGTQVSTGTGYGSDPYAGYGGQWGYYRDVETGLHLLGHRYYDASKGRFINRDPIGYEGGINVYAYCENNPLMGIDPSGLVIVINMKPITIGGVKYPPFTTGEQNTIQGQLATICKTIPSLKNPTFGGTVGQILIVKAPPGTWPHGDLHFELPGNPYIIFWDPGFPSSAVNKNPKNHVHTTKHPGGIPGTPEFILGHELCHATGIGSSNQDEQKINNMLNPILKQQGEGGYKSGGVKEH